jgi:hypothetical protein
MRRFFRPTLRRPLPRRLLPMPNPSDDSQSAVCARIVEKVDYKDGAETGKGHAGGKARRRENEARPLTQRPDSLI